MTIIHQDVGVGGGGRWGGGAEAVRDGTLRHFLGKRVLVIFKNYSIRLDLKNYIDTMIYFLLIVCSLLTFFSLYSTISLLLFIYLFIYLFKRRVESAFETSYIVVYK